jgi:hypothetical protein
MHGSLRGILRSPVMTVAVGAGICSTVATVTTYYADHPDPTIHNR